MCFPIYKYIHLQMSVDLGEVEPKPEEVSVFAFLYDLRRVPCMRESLINGIIVGLLVGGNSFRLSRHPMKACNSAILTFCGFSPIVWHVCGYRFGRERDQLHDIMKIQDKLAQTRLKDEGIKK